MEKKYFVYCAIDNEIHDDLTEDAAKKMLTEFCTDDLNNEVAESELLGSFIGTRTHIPSLKKTDSKENYPCPHDSSRFCDGDCDQAFCEDGEEWPYSNSVDYVCEVEIKPVK